MDINSQTSANNIEIERKFLIFGTLPELKNGKRIVQAYLFQDDCKEARIRISGDKCTLNIKFNIDGIVREEFEYQIPMQDGERLIEIGTFKAPIEKTRYEIIHDKMKWEIDCFEGDNRGLVIAEVELSYPSQELDLPLWVKEEVTNDLKYYNANLFNNPYKDWKERY